MRQTTLSGRAKWFVMASVGVGTFLSVIDGSIVNISLPTLQREMHTQLAVVQWVSLAYMLTTTTLMLTVGRLGDMFGKRWIYISGYSIFVLGSAMCGLASTIEVLIAFRVFQALGAVMMIALGSAIITEAFPSSQRGQALGISGLIVSLGGISGPTLGGLILGSFSWHWIFFVNVPLGIIGILVALRFIPDIKPIGRQFFDLPGALSLFFSILSLLVALTFGQSAGFNHPLVWTLLTVFAALLLAFIWREQHTSHPMIDLGLFRNPLFSVNILTGYMIFLASSGTVILMPFFLQDMLGLDPRTAGMMLVTVPISMGIVAPISGALSDRLGSRPLTVLGLASILFGFICVSTLDQNVTFWGYVLRFIPVGVGMGLFQSPNNSTIMGSVPRERLGVASGLLSMTRTMGHTTGQPINTALWSGFVLLLGGMTQPGDATTAPVAFQIAALQRSVYVWVGIILCALAFSLWAFITEQRLKRTAPKTALAQEERPNEG